MEKIFCEICNKEKETGSLELWAGKPEPDAPEICIEHHICYGCAEKIQEFIKLISKK